MGSDERSSARFAEKVGPFVVAGVAFALYAATLGHGYTLDDHEAILRHPAVTGDVGLMEVFVREYWGRPLGGHWSSSYRPLTNLTFALEHRITAAPWIHHLGNMLLYAALCGYLVRFARRWSTPVVAMGAGLVFAVLPVHVESVASIVGRADVLAGLAGLAALSACLPGPAGAPHSTLRRSLAAGLLYLVALLCKESVALLPAIAAWLLWVGHRPLQLRQWRPFAPVAALALVGVGYLVAREAVLPVGLPVDFVAADNMLVEHTGLTRLWGNFAVLGHYTELVAVPNRLCADHTYAEIVPPTSAFGTGAAWAWIGVAVAALLVWDFAAAMRGRGRGLGAAFALAYLLLGQWVIDLSVIVAERLALWPTVWLAVWIAAGANVLWERLPTSRKRNVVVLVLVLTGLAAARSVERSLDWRDSVTLQRSSVERCPAAVHSRFILANALREQGEAAEAVWHYAIAGAGRAAFPQPFDIPAFQAEQVMPLDERLRRLPELVEAPDAPRYWASLHRFLLSQGALPEADVVRRLAAEDRR